MAKQYPIIGNWYQNVSEDNFFEVVAVDEKAATIEVQYADGEIGEIEFDAWQQLVLLHAEPSEDWRMPFEIDEDRFLINDDLLLNDAGFDPVSDLDMDFSLSFDDIS